MEITKPYRVSLKVDNKRLQPIISHKIFSALVPSSTRQKWMLMAGTEFQVMKHARSIHGQILDLKEIKEGN